MRISKSIRNGVIYCISFMLLAGWLANGYFESFEQSAFDTHMRNSSILAYPDIILITADQESIDKIGEWPFSRDLIAKVIDYVNKGRPSIIATTSLMPEVQKDMGSEYLILLQNKIDQKRNELISKGLSSDPLLDSLQEELEKALITIQTDENLAATLINTQSNILLPVEIHPSNTPNTKPDSNGFKYALENRTKNNFNKTEQFYRVKKPNQILLDAVNQLGHINKTLDKDGIIRSEQFLWAVDNYLVPSLSLQLYLQHTKNKRSLNSHAEDFLARSVSHSNKNLKINDTELELPTNGKLYPRFYSEQRAQAFTEYSFYDVFVEGVPLKAFENKIILIGPVASGTTSKNHVSSGQMLAPVQNLAHVTSSLLNNDWIRYGKNQKLFEMFVYLIITLFIIFIAPRLKTYLNIIITLGSVLLLLIFEFGSLEFSYWYRLITPIIYLLLGMVALTLTTLSSKDRAQIKNKQQRERINLQLGQAFQQQGALDLALEKYLECQSTSRMLSPLYNLALDYERKREFAKASAVYEHMRKIDAAYLDTEQRYLQVKNLAMNSTQQMFGSESLLTSLLSKNSDMENPRLGRYEIESEIGRGAMSIVYAGKDPAINRTVAIKVQSFTGDDQKQIKKMRERFLTEAKTAGHLNHPDIITIYDIGEEVDLIYIAMEYLEGVSLEEYSKQNRLDDDTILEISIRMARALGYAHKHRVIHRDVKPSNIIYNESNGEVHLTDFGIARMQDAHLTQTGQVVGTPSYMSPEQITGKRVDHRSDLFSLGATMYQLFTGKLPFQADTMATLLYKITMEAPIPFDAIRADLTPKLNTIIKKLLEKEPENRYQTAEELANALEDCKNSLKNIS